MLGLTDGRVIRYRDETADLQMCCSVWAYAMSPFVYIQRVLMLHLWAKVSFRPANLLRKTQ